jgi:hypothetical protein
MAPISQRKKRKRKNNDKLTNETKRTQKKEANNEI